MHDRFDRGGRQHNRWMDTSRCVAIATDWMMMYVVAKFTSYSHAIDIRTLRSTRFVAAEASCCPETT